MGVIQSESLPFIVSMLVLPVAVFLPIHYLVYHQVVLAARIVAVLAVTLLALSTFCTCEIAQLIHHAVQHFAQTCMLKECL